MKMKTRSLKMQSNTATFSAYLNDSLARAVKLVLGLALILGAIPAFAGLPLETETARLPMRKSLTVAGAFEFQTSHEGTEKAAPFALEYGLADRLELLVEPVFYTAITPKTGPHTTGLGDLETTLTWLALHERPNRPAIALAGEIKIPTAHSVQIGTGKADLASYVVASKELGRWDTHANLSYTIVGQPAGQQLNNLLGYAAAIEYHAAQKWDIVSEVFGNTSALKETADPIQGTGESAVTPEASGGELVEMLGLRYLISPNVHLSFGVSHDNSNAWLFAPGLEFHTK